MYLYTVQVHVSINRSIQVQWTDSWLTDWLTDVCVNTIQMNFMFFVEFAFGFFNSSFFGIQNSQTQQPKQFLKQKYSFIRARKAFSWLSSEAKYEYF